jgi:hypothetical protein
MTIANHAEVDPVIASSEPAADIREIPFFLSVSPAMI